MSDLALESSLKVVRKVIQTNIASMAEEQGKKEGDLYPEVVKYLKENSAEWMSDRKPELAYDKPLCRIAYLYGIVAVNAALIEHVLLRDKELEPYIDAVQEAKGRVEVCALGGGPGTELLGAAKWLERRDPQRQVDFDFYVYDAVNHWMDSWRALRKEIEERFQKKYGSKKKWPGSVSGGGFCKVDVNDLAGWGDLGQVFGQDLYIMCYLISELFDEFEGFTDVVKTIVKKAPAGAKFLFIDRKGQRWKTVAEEVAEAAGLTLGKFKDTREFMADRFTDLRQLRTDVGRDPRGKWDAWWAVGTKEEE